MSRRKDILGGFEHLVLAAAARLKEPKSNVSRASGNSVTEEIAARTGRHVSVGAVCNTLDRMEEKGFLSSEVSDRESRRPRRFYSLTKTGEATLLQTWQVVDSIRDGLELTGTKRPRLHLKATDTSRRSGKGKPSPQAEK